VRPLTFAVTFALAAGGLSAGVAPVAPRLPGEFVARLRPAPAPAAPEAEETPAAIAERIVAQGKAAGDRLQEKDSGTFTQKTQREILADIDKLLKAPPPPPMNEGGEGGTPPPPMPMGGTPPPMGGQGGMPPPMGGQGGMPPPMGGQGGGAKPPPGGGAPKPMGGSGDQPSPRGQARKEQREREQGGKEPGGKEAPMPASPMPGGDDGKGGAKPMPGDKDGKGGQGGKTPGETGDGPGQPPAKPALPPDDAATKQVWGHLPDRLRQEMNQYYKEQFMPKYNDMLRQYYGRLAEREKGPKK